VTPTSSGRVLGTTKALKPSKRVGVARRREAYIHTYIHTYIHIYMLAIQQEGAQAKQACSS
jgi:hypothetical protein